MRRAIFLFFFLLSAGGISLHAEEILLRGGAKISAPLLKEDDEAVVVDLGFNVLRILRDNILLIRQETSSADEPLAEDTNHLYRIRSPKRLTTADAAQLYAPAVVVVKTPAGLGSGFFINKKGYLVTNFHVIAGEKHISVTQFIKEGQVLRRVVHKEVEIVATAPFHDLAILRVKNMTSPPEPVVFAPQENLHIGETVFAIGNPLGLERTVTEGVISQTARNFQGILYLQIDAPVNPGNSGGPLFNSRGQVIGVINMGVPTMEGLNFAIPAWHVTYILDHMEAFAYNAANPESGVVYPDPPRRPRPHSSNSKKEDQHETKTL